MSTLRMRSGLQASYLRAYGPACAFSEALHCDICSRDSNWLPYVRVFGPNNTLLARRVNGSTGHVLYAYVRNITSIICQSTASWESTRVCSETCLEWQS